MRLVPDSLTLAVTKANGESSHAFQAIPRCHNLCPKIWRKCRNQFAGSMLETVKGQGETKMSRKPTVEEELKESKPKLIQANDQSHKPAKHIEETARLASSVETAKDLGKVRRTKD
jgi:hypothetical protein